MPCLLIEMSKLHVDSKLYTGQYWLAQNTCCFYTVHRWPEQRLGWLHASLVAGIENWLPVCRPVLAVARSAFSLRQPLLVGIDSHNLYASQYWAAWNKRQD